MKILFEEYGYETGAVEEVLGDFLLTDLDKTKPRQFLNYVGYFFNKDITNRDGTKGDLVFILPKVLLDSDGKAFGLAPEQIMDFNFRDWKNEDLVVEGGHLSKNQVYGFIYGFATWIYRAVSLYRQNLHRLPKEEDGEEIDEGVMTSLEIGKSGKNKDATFMDILLSLLDFQRTHKNFITFTVKMAHSGFNKVSWPKTIARTMALIQDDCPIYLNPINKERVINFDEELLIIYFSILNYMHEEYGFPIPNQPGYELIKGAMFNAYIKNQGRRRLLKIRYKYYSDDAVLLWNLCYAFFDKSDNLKANGNKKDYLLVRKFETVFEGMIDELIGDKNLPKGLKVSGDDKRIDHLFTYKYLLERMDEGAGMGMNSNIYNIADSKYYRRDKELKGHDVPKQFTYARNVIQWHMDLLNGLLGKDVDEADRNKYGAIPLFDSVTEGYNIIPNFFISALVDEDLNYDIPGFDESKLGNKKGNVQESFFFWERLFDRSSYFTLHYDVNFLYVLKKYAQNKSYDKAQWKHEVRKQFRQGILTHLNNAFSFYQILIPENDIETFVNTHYRKLAGKVFSFKDASDRHILLYAERRTQSEGGPESSYSYDKERDTHIEGDCRLVIPGQKGEEEYRVWKIESLGESGYVACKEEYVLFGYYKDEGHLTWIQDNGMYNIRANQRGKDIKIGEPLICATHLILHNEKSGTHLFRIKGLNPTPVKKDDLPQSGGYKPSHDSYRIFEVEKENDDALLNSLLQSEKFRNIIIQQVKKPVALKLSGLRRTAQNKPIREFMHYLKNDENFLMSLVADNLVQYG